MKHILKVALIGNPNTGKSTVFNALTGMRQKIGNFPGVTVDKKTGSCHLPGEDHAEIIDLPGIYSLYPKAKDEQIAFRVLADKNNPHFPDVVVVVADASNLKRNLLLYSQVADLGIPVVLALNMMDIAQKAGIAIDIAKFSRELGAAEVVSMNARAGQGMDALKQAIVSASGVSVQRSMIDVEALEPGLIGEMQSSLGVSNAYEALQVATQYSSLDYLSESQKVTAGELVKKYGFNPGRVMARETVRRYAKIDEVLKGSIQQNGAAGKESFTRKLDKILTHRVGGILIFLAILWLVFESIYYLADYPMGWIEDGFAALRGWAGGWLPEGALSSLLVNGVIAGIGSFVVFIPQIVILFGFIAILEDTGYMARVVFLMDKIMSKVGLNGRSVVPLISGVACAIPGIMATRNIQSWKDRLITIMVVPLMSCSARLPVYLLLISLMVPDEKLWGIFNLQALALLMMYLLGLASALGVAYVMKFFLKMRERSWLLLEMPVYRMPRWRNVLLIMYEKAKVFVLVAGKMILAVSIVLWALATYGPPAKMAAVDEKYASSAIQGQMDEQELEFAYQSEKLENSYAGILGQAIEPVIRPLGFDWKIGIALITSFAAREVFVSTMGVIYSVGEEAEEDLPRLRDRMHAAKDPQTGQPVYTLAVAFSLMVFYAFAMQCASTVAVVYRETKGWKWPAIQWLYMTGMAYAASFIVYQILK